MSENHVFGYGSLINAASRARTGSSGAAIQVRVRGFRRAWSFRSPPHGMTALGVVRREGADVNGVLVPISESDLPLFDEREGVPDPGGYARLAIPPASVTRLDDGDLPDGPLWVYVPKRPGLPTADCPILQSYVDVVLTGCLEFGAAFADEFVRTTDGWDRPWIDDRAAPRYVRSMAAVPLAARIDAVLLGNGAVRR